MNISNKASKDYWNDNWTEISPLAIPKSDLIRNWIEKFIPNSPEPDASAIEIGCYPGGYLAVLGELGYTLNGIDMTEHIEKLPLWLNDNNYTVGKFWKEDFTSYNIPEKFNIVLSLGFIEHFVEWETVFQQHCDLIKSKGHLIMVAPNFIGKVQYFLHLIFDKENLDRHHIPAMEINRWIELLEKNNFKVIHQGFIGKLTFWTESINMSYGKLFFLYFIKIFIKLFRHILPKDRRMYSPFLGVIAQKI